MYEISFVPKRSSQPIDRRKVSGMVSNMASGISAFMAQVERKKSELEGQEKGDRESASFRREVRELLQSVVATIRHSAGTIIGSSNIRTICAPDEHLKKEQRDILDDLQGIPMHSSAHGFVRDRDSLTCASAHTTYWGNRPNSLVILNMDAKNFFPSISSVIVRTALEKNGVRPNDVNRIINLCMCRGDTGMAISVIEGLRRSGFMETAAMDEVVKILENREGNLESSAVNTIAFALCQGFLSLGPAINMVHKFLPQGAPTSPFLSNLAMKVVDIRLSAMARSFRGFYTRYADDLTVSWEARQKGKIIDGMYRCAELVLAEYGIEMNRKKKRVMGCGVRQDIVGFCVNSGHPTISRKKRENIRAAIHSELVRGSQRLRTGKRPLRKFENYESPEPSHKRICHLMGNIGYVQMAHPEEARRYFNSMNRVMAPASVREQTGDAFTSQVGLEAEGTCGTGGENFVGHEVTLS